MSKKKSRIKNAYLAAQAQAVRATGDRIDAMRLNALFVANFTRVKLRGK